MPPNKHAVLSASSSHRWLNCSPSARLELEFDDSESSAAAEGTAAHALCEHKLRRALKLRSDMPVSQYDCDEMDDYTDGYVQFVLEAIAEIKETCKDPMVLIEQRLDFSKYVPDGFGTGDCVIVGDGMLHIIDFKYGQGVLVRAEHNPQMMLYALGALGIFDGLYDIEEVSMSIYQPRRENVDTWTITVGDLRDWADNILIPKAKQAYDGEGDCAPGEWCTFCRAAIKCRARGEEKLKLASYEFATPPLLTDAEIEDILDKLDDLSKWASDIKEYALQSAVRGKVPMRRHLRGRFIMTSEEKMRIAELSEKGLGYTRIAEEIGVSVGTIKSYMYRKNVSANARKCPVCDKRITQKPGHKEKRFCSDKCRMEWWSKHQDEITHKTEYTFVCAECGVSFTTFRKDAKYCTHKCYSKSCRKEPKI